MINDSWEMIAQVDWTDSFPPLPPARAVLHDLVCLAVCMGGLMLMLFNDIRDRQAGQADRERVHDWELSRRFTVICQWMLGAVA
jgi:hypothetical protein